MLPLLFAAQAASDTSSADLTADHAVRRGAVVGLTLGGGIGQGEGYPNNSDDIGKIGYARSRWMPGSGVTLLVMGALSDYLSFGFWYAHLQFDSSGWRARRKRRGPSAGGLSAPIHPAQREGRRALRRVWRGDCHDDCPRCARGLGNAVCHWLRGFLRVVPFSLSGWPPGSGPLGRDERGLLSGLDQTGLVVGLRTVFYGGP